MFVSKLFFRRLALACAAFIALAASARADLITSMDDIQYWVGSGTNSAVLVIDWNDGATVESLAWGYHWDGTATGEDMLLAIAGLTTGDISATGADSQLTIYVTSYSFGDVVDRIVYGTEHDQGGFLGTGYWEYFNMGGDFYTPPDGDENTFAGSIYYPGTNGTPDWISSWSGFSDRVLSNGSWDAWSYAVDGTSQGVTQPIAAEAVPEPATFVLLAIGLLSIPLWRRVLALRA